MKQHPLLVDFRDGYIEAMLWCNTVTNATFDFVDAREHQDKLHPCALEEATGDCLDFLISLTDATVDATVSREWAEFIERHHASEAGCCFALSRCGHGAGFFDKGRGYRALQKHAKVWGDTTWLLTEQGEVTTL